MNTFKLLIVLTAVLCFTNKTMAAVGEAIAVTPQEASARHQVWADAAWSDAANCWLVVWREGYLNESVSDIWCARVSIEGKSLDASGIRLTTGVGLKDSPRVAAGENNFLVVWEDLRNGKDWDVYGARVSLDGKNLDKDGFKIAGGKHNQCRPAVAFAENNYHVVWMGFEGQTYRIFGVCGPVGSSQGFSNHRKLYDIKSSHRYEKRGNPRQCLMPTISANRKGEVLVAFFVTDMRYSRHTIRLALDGKTGVPVGEPSPEPAGKRDKMMPGMLGEYREDGVALALGPDNALQVSASATTFKSKKDISFARVSKAGKVEEILELGSSLTVNDKFKPIAPRQSVVFDGNSYVIVDQCLWVAEKKKRAPSVRRVRIVGWRVNPDGKIENEDGFLIAGKDKKDCMLPATSVGPKGTVLIVYSEVRGVDDVKVVARIIR